MGFLCGLAFWCNPIFSVWLVPMGISLVGMFRGTGKRSVLIGFSLGFLAGRVSFALFCIIATFTVLYSAPPWRTKRLGLWANFTIAVPRGCLVPVVGWSAVTSVWQIEPWYLGLTFFLYLLGASSSKDFADAPGDRACGIQTLPVKYGAREAARIVTPFLGWPWLLIPLGAHNHWLSGDRTALTVLGAALAAWGFYQGRLMLREPERLATEGNHISWKHMVLMLIAAPVGIAISYWLTGEPPGRE